MIRTHGAGLALLMTGTLLLAGCGSKPPAPDNRPSYAELVVIYNAELESLDRLERKRADLVAEHEKQSRPDPNDAVRALAGAFDAALGGIRDNAGDVPSDPQAALDRAVESAERAQDAVAQMFQAIKPPAGEPATGEPATDAASPADEEFARQLGLLDQEIEQQRARVERARQARDAAERDSLSAH